LSVIRAGATADSCYAGNAAQGRFDLPHVWGNDMKRLGHCTLNFFDCFCNVFGVDIGQPYMYDFRSVLRLYDCIGNEIIIMRIRLIY
jgi:hypothetical protein